VASDISSLGGSIKDDESIAAANENGIAMAFRRPSTDILARLLSKTAHE